MIEDNDRPMPPNEASVFLGGIGFPIAVTTLAHKRVAGDGPQFLKFGSRVFYRPSALRSWADATAKPMASTSATLAA
jgi:hypothetical protein